MHARDYTAADRQGCLAVFDSNVPRYFVTEERAEFAAFLEELPGPYFVLLDGEAVVGCGGYALEEDGVTASFCWGMVDQRRHGTGLGRRLAEERLARIRADARVGRVQLHTSQHTRGFYERVGFVTLGVTPDAYAPGLDRCDMLLELAR